MNRLHPEGFITDFENYFKEQILIADLIAENKVIAIAKPFLNFSEVVMRLADDIFEVVDFHQRLEIHLYEFGYNHCIKIKLN